MQKPPGANKSPLRSFSDNKGDDKGANRVTDGSGVQSNNSLKVLGNFRHGASFCKILRQFCLSATFLEPHRKPDPH